MYKVTVNNKEYKTESDSQKKMLDSKEYIADTIEYKKGKFHIIRNYKSYSAEIVEHNSKEKTFIIKINNHTYTVSVKDKYDELLSQMGMDVAAGKKVNDIKAPMPGMVLNVLVQAGMKIKKGDSIVVLEAMKMENVLKASSDGEVKKIFVSKGDKVEKNQVMINLV